MIYVVIFCLASVSAFYHPSFESVVPEVLQATEIGLIFSSQTIGSLAAVYLVNIGACHQFDTHGCVFSTPHQRFNSRLVG